MNNREVSHYVVTAHPPGGVLHTVKCNFLEKDSEVRMINAVCCCRNSIQVHRFFSFGNANVVIRSFLLLFVGLFSCLVYGNVRLLFAICFNPL